MDESIVYFRCGAHGGGYRIYLTHLLSFTPGRTDVQYGNGRFEVSRSVLFGGRVRTHNCLQVACYSQLFAQ